MNKADITVHEVCDGMGTPDMSGSYVRVAIAFKDGRNESVLISLGTAEILGAELHGAIGMKDDAVVAHLARNARGL